MKKPDAVTVITEENFKQKFGHWESVKWQAQEKLQKKLNKIGIFSLGDLAHAPAETLKSLLGINGVYLWQYANGLDIRPIVDRDHTEPIKSIGNSSTCKRDLHSDEEVFNVMQELSFSVSRRLREAKLEARGVEVFVRNNQLQSWNFAIPLEMASQSSIILVRRAMEIFKKNIIGHFQLGQQALGQSICAMRVGAAKWMCF